MCKKFYLLALTAIIVLISFVITDLKADYVCGDANSDGLLNVSDAVFIINYVFVGGPAPDPDCCETTGMVTDFDGNIYQTVKIGNQWWMMENLKVTHYRNGDPIPNVIDSSSWAGLSTGAYSSYDNDEGNAAVYGRLYNWFAISDSRNIAPEGWHVASDEDWKQMEMYLGMSQAQANATGWRGTDEGGKLKEAGTTHWLTPNTGATNESGFTGLPNGWRTHYGNFSYMGIYASFWTSTESGSDYAWCRHLAYNNSQVNRNANIKHPGFSVRCVRDTDAARGSSDYVCGDANGDGLLNVSDAVFIINYVFIGGSAPDPDCCPDCPSTVTDYDGNVYQTVLIGDQCWMMENLKVTHYRNGDPISNVTDNSTWCGLFTGAYCDYNNDEGQVAVYGRLYNFYAISDSRNIAPTGWHVSTDAEWKQMEMFLGMSQAQANGTDWRGTDEGGKLKEVGTMHWNSPNTGATNESGFTALPGGYRLSGDGSFNGMGICAIFWSSTQFDGYSAWDRILHYGVSEIGRFFDIKQGGFSVRCVKGF